MVVGGRRHNLQDEHARNGTCRLRHGRRRPASPTSRSDVGLTCDDTSLLARARQRKAHPVRHRPGHVHHARHAFGGRVPGRHDDERRRRALFLNNAPTLTSTRSTHSTAAVMKTYTIRTRAAARSGARISAAASTPSRTTSSSRSRPCANTTKNIGTAPSPSPAPARCVPCPRARRPTPAHPRSTDARPGPPEVLPSAARSRHAQSRAQAPRRPGSIESPSTAEAYQRQAEGVRRRQPIGEPRCPLAPKCRAPFARRRRSSSESFIT